MRHRHVTHTTLESQPPFCECTVVHTFNTCGVHTHMYLVRFLFVPAECEFFIDTRCHSSMHDLCLGISKLTYLNTISHRLPLYPRDCVEVLLRRTGLQFALEAPWHVLGGARQRTDRHRLPSGADPDRSCPRINQPGSPGSPGPLNHPLWETSILTA